MLEDTHAFCAVVFLALPGTSSSSFWKRNVVPALQRIKTKREVRKMLRLLGGGGGGMVSKKDDENKG
jgi:hypothetical protein